MIGKSVSHLGQSPSNAIFGHCDSGFPTFQESNVSKVMAFRRNQTL